MNWSDFQKNRYDWHSLGVACPLSFCRRSRSVKDSFLESGDTLGPMRVKKRQAKNNMILRGE
jgi:hypothetical protein